MILSYILSFKLVSLVSSQSMLFAIYALWFTLLGNTKGDGCRLIQFGEGTENKVLRNHIIRSDQVTNREICKLNCYLEPNYVSYNYGPYNGRLFLCELSDKTHLQASPNELEVREGFTYNPIFKNACLSGPCPSNSTCQAGFNYGKYRCVCPRGYKGEKCQYDVKECFDGTHNCSSKAVCADVPGTFQCSCASGYVGNGVNCSGDCGEAGNHLVSLRLFGDVDECVANTHSCHSYANCTNTDGSFRCVCKSGFTGNGFNCTRMAVPCFSTAIGVADRSIIPDNQMTSSTYYSPFHPYIGRLNLAQSGWCAQSGSGTQDWLKVDLGRTFQICGVATQGLDHNVYDAWVKDFKIAYSNDGGGWTTYRYPSGTETLFRRNGGENTVYKHNLPAPVSARYIRFHPVTQNNWNCLRVEVYGTAV